MDENQEENLFQPEEVDRRVYEVASVPQILDELLLKTPYEENKIEELQNKACEKIMKMLVDYNLNFKYISSLALTESTARSSRSEAPATLPPLRTTGTRTKTPQSAPPGRRT